MSNTDFSFGWKSQSLFFVFKWNDSQIWTRARTWNRTFILRGLRRGQYIGGNLSKIWSHMKCYLGPLKLEYKYMQLDIRILKNCHDWRLLNIKINYHQVIISILSSCIYGWTYRIIKILVYYNLPKSIDPSVAIWSDCSPLSHVFENVLHKFSATCDQEAQTSVPL